MVQDFMKSNHGGGAAVPEKVNRGSAVESTTHPYEQRATHGAGRELIYLSCHLCMVWYDMVQYGNYPRCVCVCVFSILPGLLQAAD